MQLPPEVQVRAALRGLEDLIEGIFRGAWDDWRKSPQSAVWRCKRGRANFVWEQIIHRAHIAFDGRPEVRIISGHETFSFLARDRVLFRCKLGDETGLSKNFPTQLALAYHDQDADLFGLPKVHRVEIVYTLNKLETAISDVLVVARNDDAVLWTYSLQDPGAEVIPLELATKPKKQTPSKDLVRARDLSEADKSKNSD